MSKHPEYPVSPFLRGAVAITPPRTYDEAVKRHSIPATRAQVCADCDHISLIQSRCPRCGSDSCTVLR